MIRAEHHSWSPRGFASDSIWNYTEALDAWIKQMTIDVSGLSAKELKALIAQAEKQQTKVLTRPKAAAMRAKINQYVKEHGYTIEELYGAVSTASSETSRKRTGRKPAKSAGSKVAPKYRNPANPSETWSGRGRQPRWLAALVQKGKEPSEFLIK
jgi:DNA-binding protein H-NS